MASGSRRIEYTESISKEISKALLSVVAEGLFVWSLEGERSELLRGERGKIGVGKTQGNSGQGGRLRYACGGGNGGDRRARSQRNGMPLQGSAFRPVLLSSGDAQEHSGSMKRSRGANASALS